MNDFTSLGDYLGGTFSSAIGQIFSALDGIATLTASPSSWGVVLSVCLAIRGVKAALELSSDDDGLASLGAALVRGALLAVVLAATLQSWPAIISWGWGVAGEAVAFAASYGGFAAVSGSSGQEIVLNSLQALFSAAVRVYTEMWSAVLGFRSDPDSWFAALEAMAKMILPALMALGAALCALVFIGVLTYHVVVSAFGVAVGFVFGPIAIAFFPLISSWTFNLVGLAAASIARLMMTLFIAGAATRAAIQLVTPLQREISDAFARSQMLLVIGVVLVLLAASASALIGFAGQIFGNANGSIGFGRGTRGAVARGAAAARSTGGAVSRLGALVGGRAIGAAGGRMMAPALDAAARGQASQAGVGAQIGGALSSGGARLASYASSKSRK